ncbi:MAG TPA: putative Ig domain-containing protein, partial [Bryobacteraceae bacterium]|nr:putative Ig domain-containing protein [Bryobacteraceae bacterium]
EVNAANDSASDPTAVNPALTITSFPNAVTGNQYSQILSANGGVGPYTWSAIGLPSWLSLTTGGVLSGSPPTNFYGNVPFALTVTDSIGDLTTVNEPFAVQLPTLLVGQASFTATAGSGFSGTVNAVGGLKPYTWSGSSLPSWLSIDSTGRLTGTPPLYGSAGSYTLTLTVTDAASNTASVSAPLAVNPAPITITPLDLSPATVGVDYQVTFTASGGTGKYTWSASSLPSGFSLSPAGLLDGTAAQGSTGTYPFSITVTDSASLSGSANLTLQVNPPPLVITTLSNLSGATETMLYTTSLVAQGGVQPYNWSATGLPSWLTLGTDGTLSGTPPVGSAGTISFNATVADSSTQTAQATFQLVVSTADSVLGIDTDSTLPFAMLGVQYNQSLSAHGGTPPYTWTEAAIAPGLSLSSSGVISGTPTVEMPVSFTGQVNDKTGASAFRQFNLGIASPGLAIQNPPALATGQIGVPYSQQLSASGGGQQLTWSISHGTLPQGISLSPDGIVHGTPLQTGTFSFDVAVNNSTGPAAQAAHLRPHATSQSFHFDVEPSSANLVFSAASLSFSAVSGGSAPPSQAISIITSSPQPLPFSVTTDSPWLQVSPSSASTPGNIVVSVNPINLEPGQYSASIGFATPGNPPQTVGVSFSVGFGKPALAASPESLQISDRSGSSTPVTGPIIVQNTGSGFLSFSATILGAPWLSLDQSSGVLSPNQTDTLTFTASSNALAPGVYRGRIEIGSNSGFADIPVTLTVPAQNRLILSGTGTLIEARQGAGISGPATQSFSILASEDSALNWTASLAGTSSFLTLVTTSGISTNTVPGTVTYQVDSTGLDVGSYYARIEIASADAANSPQEFVVVLNVISSATPASPNPSPAGLLFVSSDNGSPAQTVTVFTSSSASVGFQAAASTETGSPWLSVTPLSGQVSSDAPAQLTVSVSPSGLAPGVYRGTVNIAQGNLEVRGVNVTLIVPGSATQPSTSAKPAPRAAPACSASSLVITYTVLTKEFSTPAAWPGTIGLTLSDNCGGAVDNGSIELSFSNGDPALQPILSDPATGFYSATWVPQNSGPQVTITAQATAPGLTGASANLIGSVLPNLAPVISKNGILHDLNPQVGAALAPGTVVQIFGSQLAGATAASNGAPLPLNLQGTSVLIGAVQAPLFYISPGQVNAQIPFELVPGHEYPVIVAAGNSYTVPESIQLAPLAPGVARLTDGSIIAQHADFTLVTKSSPAKPGEYLVAYLAGMGLTDSQVQDGAASPSSPLANVSVAPGVTLNGAPVKVIFAGLTPGLVGLYQINFQIPADASTGDLVFQVTQHGVAADAGTVTVQK